MEEIRIWHNSRCSKSRQTLEILESRDLKPIVVPYLETPPTASELDQVLKLLELEPRDLMRKKEKPYSELRLDNAELSRDELIQAMIEHPILIERPVVIRGPKAMIGRPPENVLKLL